MLSGALDADQSALKVVANNVAGANTPGYTEETPTWKENPPISIHGVSYGEGITETGSKSMRDRVLEQRLDQQQQLSSASSTRLTALDNIQGLFPPSSGSASSTAGNIGSDLTGFFSSFSSLEGTPTSVSLREAVLSKASTLAADVSGAAAGLHTQRLSLDQEAGNVVSQVNSLSSAIAQVTQQIQSSSPHEDAGSLEDERQEDLSKLSQLIGINQTTTENNGLTVTTTSGQLLVSEGESRELTTGSMDGVTHFFIGSADVTKELASGGGELGGYLTARDVDIPSVLSSLDQLAHSVTTEVNSVNTAGTDANGNQGANIFSDPPSPATDSASMGPAGSAAAMSVVLTDPNGIAAAAPGQGAGDDANAVSMAGLAKKTIVDGQTPSNYYSSFVGTLGATVTTVQTENTALTASVTQLRTQNDAHSRVNLDDEAAAMSTVERSYQAASRAFAILNTIMASALNLGEGTTVS